MVVALRARGRGGGRDGAGRRRPALGHRGGGARAGTPTRSTRGDFHALRDAFKPGGLQGAAEDLPRPVPAPARHQRAHRRRRGTRRRGHARARRGAAAPDAPSCRRFPAFQAAAGGGEAGAGAEAGAGRGRRGDPASSPRASRPTAPTSSLEGEVSVGRNGKTLANLRAGHHVRHRGLHRRRAPARRAASPPARPGCCACRDARLRQPLRRGQPLRLPDGGPDRPPAGAARARGQPDDAPAGPPAGQAKTAKALKPAAAAATPDEPRRSACPTLELEIDIERAGLVSEGELAPLGPRPG